MNKYTELLCSIDRVVKAIDKTTDWFILYIQEQDPDLKNFYSAMHEKTTRELQVLAINERSKNV